MRIHPLALFQHWQLLSLKCQAALDLTAHSAPGHPPADTACSTMHWTSSGFIATTWPAQKVNVLGFGASKDRNWHHYYDKRYHLLNTEVHRGSAEYHITLKLHQKNKIQMYKGW
ncbi:hypothetical protein MHYP_G00173530 [Metynnis hypsauchen]